MKCYRDLKSEIWQDISEIAEDYNLYKHRIITMVLKGTINLVLIRIKSNFNLGRTTEKKIDRGVRGLLLTTTVHQYLCTNNQAPIKNVVVTGTISY